MSDPVDDAFEKYIKPSDSDEQESRVDCPRCGSDLVDRKSGYRGEYRCNDCGYFWQVGGRNAS